MTRSRALATLFFLVALLFHTTAVSQGNHQPTPEDHGAACSPHRGTRCV